jgi:hypothetical protein
VRLAVLVHAATVEPEEYQRLVALLTGLGDVRVARAHADWTLPEVRTWLPHLRRYGLQLRHHFRTRASHDPAAVAVTVDALELAAAGTVDQLVLVGDLGATTPLVWRLRELGIPVVAAGPASTPHDFREACWEFLDLGSLEGPVPPGTGRHRVEPD